MRDFSPSRFSPKNSILRRTGWQALCTLVLTMLANVAVVGFISFLWFADYDNTHWHNIMVEGWATRSVSISTLILRFSIDLQAGVACAMLAAIILESCSVSLRRSAQVSVMRASYPQPRSSLDLITAMGGNGWALSGLDAIGYSIVVLLLFTSTTLLQFSSTALLSDLQLGRLPGLQINKSSTYDFAYEGHGSTFPVSDGYFDYTRGVTYPVRWRSSTWTRNPPAFPAFAEYSEPVSVAENIDDTGVLLRAFLPFADAQSRESIRNYSGNAMVLDARVSCQSPKFVNISVHTPYADYTTGRFNGNMRGLVLPSDPHVPRLWSFNALPFDCSPFVNAPALTICQIGSSATNHFWESSTGLLSEFWNITEQDTQNALRNGLSTRSLPMLVIRSYGSPILSGDRLNQDVEDTESKGSWTRVSTSSLHWDVSICYSAWDTADLDVETYSDHNRTEPILHWDEERDYYTVPDVHSQMGEPILEASPESRGIMHLVKKSSWAPKWSDAIPTSVKPFVKEFADLSEDGNLQQEAPLACSPCSALLLPANDTVLQIAYNRTTVFTIDYTLSSLFRQTIGEDGTGSVARAMSSLITTLSSMAYYDQMPQFQKSATTTQTYFVTVLFPQSHLGFWAVVAVLTVHTGLVNLVALGFVLRSHHTFLGNYWQSVAQLLGPGTEDLISKTRMATDQEVKRAMTLAGHADLMANVRIPKDGSDPRLRITKGV